jgi:hypothetical protein
MDEIKKIFLAIITWVRNVVAIVAAQVPNFVATISNTVQSHISNPKQLIMIIILASVALDLIFTGKVGIVGALTGILTNLITAVQNMTWQGLGSLVVVYFIIDRLKK